MIDGFPVTETLTQVEQTESVAEQPNPFAVITDNNQNKVDVADSSRGPHENLDQQALENQMKVMIEMQKARENIASAHVSQGEVGGETIAGGNLSYDEPNQTNAAEPGVGINEEDARKAFFASPEGQAEVNKAAAADPYKRSYFKFVKGPAGTFFRTMEENGDIPRPGDGLAPTLVKSILLPVNIVKTVIKSAWNWTKAEVNAFADKIASLLPKSAKQPESSSTSSSSPPPVTSLNQPPLAA